MLLYLIYVWTSQLRILCFKSICLAKYGFQKRRQVFLGGMLCTELTDFQENFKPSKGL